MSHKPQHSPEFVNVEVPAQSIRRDGLIITPNDGATLSPAQVEFNRLMKRLESTRTKYTREQSRLDQFLATSIQLLMPLLDELHRLMRDLVFNSKQALLNTKLSSKRRYWLSDLVSGKASDLLLDPSGLSEAEIGQIEAIIEELGPSKSDQQTKECEDDDFDFIRDMIERAAKDAGVDLDLSDLDIHGDPMELERALHERLRGISGKLGEKPAPRRKPTKAQLDKERLRLEQEEAKTRDFKSLYKQLAKALHPDLETDPELKLHKEVWMKRLTTAYSNGDLRDLLQIEMEWLGEEATHLTTAGDAKLRVYCKVLKEQIADLKRQTNELHCQPQYGPLRRFMDPFTGSMQNPALLQVELLDEIRRHKEMLMILQKGGQECKKMIEKWADAHAQASRMPRFPF